MLNLKQTLTLQFSLTPMNQPTATPVQLPGQDKNLVLVEISNLLPLQSLYRRSFNSDKSMRVIETDIPSANGAPMPDGYFAILLSPAMVTRYKRKPVTTWLRHPHDVTTAPKAGTNGWHPAQENVVGEPLKPVTTPLTYACAPSRGLPKKIFVTVLKPKVLTLRTPSTDAKGRPLKPGQYEFICRNSRGVDGTRQTWCIHTLKGIPYSELLALSQEADPPISINTDGFAEKPTPSKTPADAETIYAHALPEELRVVVSKPDVCFQNMSNGSKTAPVKMERHILIRRVHGEGTASGPVVWYIRGGRGLPYNTLKEMSARHEISGLRIEP